MSLHRYASRSGFLALVAVAALLSGCGGSSKNAVEKRLGDLREEITRLQNSQDRLAERMMAMEIQRQQDTTRASAPAAPAAGPRMERPPLKVIRLEPGQPAGAPAAPAADEVPATEDDEKGQRPVIKLRGKQGSLEAAPSRASGAKLSQNDSARAASRGT